MSGKRIGLIMIFVFIGLLIINSTAVQAVNGEVVVEKEVELKVDKQYEGEYDAILNQANESNRKYSNYNMTWKPFKNDTDEKGVVSATPQPPNLMSLNIRELEEDEWLHTATPVSFSYEQVMQGTSESWWRSPYNIQTDDFDFRLRIYRISQTDRIKLQSDGENLKMNPITHPTKIYDSDVINVSDSTLKSHSVEIPDELVNESVSYEFLYNYVVAPIYADENYLPVFSVKGIESPVEMYFNPQDVGGNDYNKTHLSWSNKIAVKDANCDIGVLHTYGQSEYTGGMSLSGSKEYDSEADLNLQWRNDFSNLIREFDIGEYLTLNFPFVYSKEENVNISYDMDFLDSSGNNMGTYEDDGNHSNYYLSSVSYFLVNNAIGPSNDVEDIDEIKVTLGTNGECDYEDFKLFTYDYNNNFSTSYKYSHSEIYLNGEKSEELGYKPWSSIQVTEGEWERIEPKDMYSYEELKIGRDEGINWRTVIEHGALYASGAVGLAISTYIMQNYGDTPPTEVMRDWLGTAGRYIVDKAMDIGEPLISFGQWLWEGIQWVVENIQYYGKALINLFVVGFSIATYIIFTAVTVKVSLGMIILVRKGIDPMFEYYSTFMDDLIGMSKQAKGLIPVL